MWTFWLERSTTRPQLNRTRPNVVSVCPEEIDSLHRAKSASYGPAWRKRGEVFSILCNVFRKFDRLEIQRANPDAIDGEPLYETLVDLFLYLVKYQVYLELLLAGVSLDPLTPDDGEFLNRCSQLIHDHLDAPGPNEDSGDVIDRVIHEFEAWNDEMPPVSARLAIVCSGVAASSLLLAATAQESE